jgi:hypothetical protein
VKINKLSLKDKIIFNKYLSLERHELSVYAFADIYIWKSLFEISWFVIEENLCIFFRDRVGCFMYLSALGRKMSQRALNKSFEYMDKFNKNKEISRIENIEEKDVHFYKELGLDCREKSHDYFCNREDLVSLRGNKFKSKRASVNFFTKHYPHELLPYSLHNRNDCLKLYAIWAGQRSPKNNDSVYQGMIEDGLTCLKIVLENYKDLGLAGRIIKVDNELKAFSFGYKLNPDTFCILYEITDLTIKGLAQFIFQKFSSELKGYVYINVMDDSGLENLKQVKLSYQPVKLIPAFIAKRAGVS